MLPCLFTTNVFCTPSSAFFGAMGVAFCLTLCNLGSAYGTAKAGISLAYLGIMDKKKSMKGLITSVFAGVMAIYGVVMSAILISNIKMDGTYSNYLGYCHFAAGITTGMTSLSAGVAIGIISDAGVRQYGKSDAVFIPMILLLIFAEVLAIYGIIVGIMITYIKKGPNCEKISPPTFSDFY